MGLLTGLIGLLLRSSTLLQYRLLGFVTIASLVVAGTISLHEAIALLVSLNYRLSLGW